MRAFDAARRAAQAVASATHHDADDLLRAAAAVAAAVSAGRRIRERPPGTGTDVSTGRAAWLAGYRSDRDAGVDLARDAAAVLTVAAGLLRLAGRRRSGPARSPDGQRC